MNNLLLELDPSTTNADIWKALDNASRTNQIVFIPLPERIALSRFLEKFQCRRGGLCCTQETSVLGSGICIEEFEIPVLAQRLNLTREEFLSKHCKQVPTGWSMNFPCPFFIREDNKGSCGIYDARPLVCKVFPLGFRDNPSFLEIGIQVICPGGRITAYKILSDILLDIKQKAGK